jgi:hypothetical protein
MTTSTPADRCPPQDAHSLRIGPDAPGAAGYGDRLDGTSNRAAYRRFCLYGIRIREYGGREPLSASRGRRVSGASLE